MSTSIFSCVVGLVRLCMYVVLSFVSSSDLSVVPQRLQVGLLSMSSLLLSIL